MPRSPRRSARLAQAAFVVLAAVFAVAAFPQAAGAEGPALPPNEGCEQVAVVAKLGVVEDRAAANMLAEAVRVLGLGERCLVDAGDPSANRAPEGSRGQLADADRVFVVGGPAAIPDSWIAFQLGVSEHERIAGGNRWATQSAVAAAMVSLARGEPVAGYSGQPASSPTLPPNTGCTNAVLVKLSVVEDRAAANMLAEAFNHLSANGDNRCLLDAGNPSTRTAPTADDIESYEYADFAHVVGGATAIPPAWLDEHFNDQGRLAYVRLSGTDRWGTQSAVARRILGLAVPSRAEDVTLTRQVARSVDASSVTKSTRQAMLTLPVYYCGAEASYTTELLDQRVKELSEVADFFRRQSGGQASITFTRGSTSGGILTNPAIARYTDIQAWYKATPKIHNECLAGVQLDNSKVVLLLGDAPGGGYAYRPTDPSGYGGPAVVSTPEKLHGGISGFLRIAAHEIAHAFYALRHPWVDYPYLCKLIRDIEGVEKVEDISGLAEEDVESCVKYHSSAETLGSDESDYLFGSIMSYGRYGAIENLQPGGAYVACYQKAQAHLGWVEPYECDGSRARTPDYPLPPVVRPEVNAVSVEWSEPSSNGADITGYDVEYRRVGDPGWQSVHRAGTIRRVDITGLQAATRYLVRVRAINRIGPSPWSTPAEATTLATGTTRTPQVRLSRGDRVVGHSGCTHESCRWLHVEIDGFPDGVHTLACGHNGVHQIGAHRGIFRYVEAAVANGRASTRDCFFGYPGNEVFVIVGAERRDGEYHGGTWSNIVEWTTSTTPPPPASPELTVWRGSIKVDGGICKTTAVGCRWVVGSGTGWPAGDQFWIKCGDFVDTSRNKPVKYLDRFVDRYGNLSWGEAICYNPDAHTVEVWTESGARKTVNIR